MAIDPSIFVHPNAIVESDAIGSGTRIWAFAHIMKDVPVGENCNISDHVTIETGSHIGNRVTIKQFVGIGDGVYVEDDVFIGPGVLLPNDPTPRSPRMAQVAEVTKRYSYEKNWLKRTRIGRGASLGTGALIAPGLSIGEFAMVTMGAVVTKDVPPHRIVAGVPARGIGWACVCGVQLQSAEDKLWLCPDCGRRYSREENQIHLLSG